MKLDEIRALCEAATPGPWGWHEDPNPSFGPIEAVGEYGHDGAVVIGDDDAKFITAARKLMPLLLDVAESASECFGELGGGLEFWGRMEKLKEKINVLEGA